MIHYIFKEIDLRYLYLKGDNPKDDEILNEMMSHFNLISENCKRPNYKGQPYTEDFLFKFTQKGGTNVYYCEIGLWQEVLKYFKANNIEFDGLTPKYFKRDVKHTFEEFKDIVDGWGLSLNPRPYQYEAAYKILQWNTSLSELATRAGKTIVSYMVFRYSMEYLGAKKILMIVPSIDLVRQGYNDFKKYKEFFKAECIWSGGKLVQSANLTIGTFQSLIKYIDRTDKKYDPSFFDAYDLMFVDEVHRGATADQIKNILGQPFVKRLKIAFGMTGTLPEENTTPRFCLAALLGARIQQIKPIDLMNEGYISKVEIRQKMLYYKDKKYLDDLYIRAAEYRLSQYEIVKIDGKEEKVELENPEFLFRHKKNLPYGIQQIKDSIETEEDKQNYIKALIELVTKAENANNLSVEQLMVPLLKNRVDYIINLLYECDRNTLILGTHVEYVKYMYERISNHFPNRKVVMITGSVNAKKRSQINDILRDNDNCILVANYATCSTGLTFSGLCYGIFAESFKSNIVNMQSIGRGLALVEGKDKYIVYDLIDCLHTKKIYLQGKAKQKIYEKNEYPYNVQKVNI